MLAFEVLVSLLTAGTFIFLLIQFRTTFFSVRYGIQVASMLALGGLSFGLLFVLLSGGLGSLGGRSRVISSVLLASSAALWLGLSMAKLFFFAHTRVSSSTDLLTRNLCKLSAAHKRFTVRTSDGVYIRGYHIRSGKPAVIIFCHGGGSNKNALGSVLTCEWLSSDYDVIGFDFRGHLESGGTWAGDHRTALDLKAVVEYAEDCHYQKKALVGMSMGGWSALVQAATDRNVDAVVAASPPPTTMRAVIGFKPMFDWGMSWWAAPVRWGVRVLLGIRFAGYRNDLSLDGLVEDMEGIPLLLTFYEHDPIIGVNVEEFKELLHMRAGGTADLLVYPGTAHVTTPHDIFRLHSDVRAWLARHLGDLGDTVLADMEAKHGREKRPK